jgi:hypothetical protein
MDSSVAALVGAATGALAGVSGPIVSGAVENKREIKRWFLDSEKAAYVAAINSLSRAMYPMSTYNQYGVALAEKDGSLWLGELVQSQAAIATLTAFCTDSVRANIEKALNASIEAIESVRETPKPGEAPAFDLAGLFTAYGLVVESARDDLRS